MSGILRTVRDSLTRPSGPGMREGDLEQGVITEEPRGPNEKAAVQEGIKSVQSNGCRKKHVRIAKSATARRLRGKRAITSPNDWIEVDDSPTPPRQAYSHGRIFQGSLDPFDVKPYVDLQEPAPVVGTRPHRSGKTAFRTGKWRASGEYARKPNLKVGGLTASSPVVLKNRSLEQPRESPKKAGVLIQRKEAVFSVPVQVQVPEIAQTAPEIVSNVPKKRPRSPPNPGGQETKIQVFGTDEMERFYSHDFETRLQELHESSVIDATDGAVTVNLASLQRIHLLRLQKALTREAFSFKYEKPLEGSYFRASTTMHQYTQALADWEFIKTCALRGKMNDPFILTTERTRDLTLLKEVAADWRREASGVTWMGERCLISKFDEDIKRFGSLPQPKDKGQPEVIFGGSRTVMNKKEEFERFMQRLTMAAIGGAFLVGPMLVMVLKKGQLITLLTSSLCTVAFGFVLALYLDKPFEVLSGTAAYAAVLVVFVGTSGS